jgi:hypothetical protein
MQCNKTCQEQLRCSQAVHKSSDIRGAWMSTLSTDRPALIGTGRFDIDACYRHAVPYRDGAQTIWFFYRYAGPDRGGALRCSRLLPTCRPSSGRGARLLTIATDRPSLIGTGHRRFGFSTGHAVPHRGGALQC